VNVSCGAERMKIHCGVTIVLVILNMRDARLLCSGTCVHEADKSGGGKHARPVRQGGPGNIHGPFGKGAPVHCVCGFV
jgi:hypothetical protein